MARIRWRGSKENRVAYIDFRFKGRRHVVSTKTSDKKIAMQILHDIQGKIARGSFNLDEYEKQEISLSEFLKKYFEFAESWKAKGTVAAERIYSRTLMMIIRDRNLRSIDAQCLDQWKARRLEAAISPTTLNIERRSLHSMFNVAKKWKYIDDNPFASVKGVRVEERRLFMTAEELNEFFTAVRVKIASTKMASRRARLQLFCLYCEFLLNTGLRRAEALRLKRGNVDLERNAVYVEKTKDKETRIIPLTPRAREILVSLDDRMFSSLSKQSVSRHFAMSLKDAGLHGFKLHSLRHSFSTALVDMGVDLVTISRLLGHSDVKTTMIYAKTQLGVMRSAIEKLEKLPVHGYKMVTNGSGGEEG
jgi:integrase/recombinase XerD